MANSKAKKWVSGKEAAEALGCSTYHLDKLRKDGTLKRGKHFKNIASKNAMRPSYRYNLGLILRDLI